MDVPTQPSRPTRFGFARHLLNGARALSIRSRPLRQRFGFVAGWRLALAFRQDYKLAPGTPFAVPLPGLPHPVFLRAGSTDRDVFRQVWLDQELDIRMRKSPTTIVDAGAHIGLASLKFASLYPEAQIVALEIDPTNVSLLRRNTAPYPRINVLHKALWRAAGHVKIENPEDDAWAFRAREVQSSDPAAIEATGIAQLLGDLGVDRIDLLKLDIEGAEIEVFTNGQEDWIDRVGIIVVELHDRFRPGCEQAVRSAIGRRSLAEAQVGEHLVFYLGN